MKTLATIIALLALMSTSLTASARVQPQAPLKLNTSISHPHLPANTTQEVYATVRVTGGPAQATAERAPLNVALVIDRSTSMSGGRLEQAKHAAIQFVRMLQPTDRLAIVSYGSDVSQEMVSKPATPQNKELMELAIGRIELSGATNLSGGLELGVQLISGHRSDETVNRVLLLSDGHANNGITSVEGLANLARGTLEKGISISTMGIGLDYNEELMTQIAVNAAGNYYFVEDEKALAQIFEKEAKGLSSTVARKAVLTLTAGPGVEVLGIDGYTSRTKGNKTTVSLAEFYANQAKDLLVRMSVTTPADGSMKVLSAYLSFEAVGKDEKSAISKTMSASVTTNRELVQKVDTGVMKRVQQAEVARNMEEAMKAYERGEAQKAAEIVRAQRQSNAAKGAKYDFADDADFARVNEELAEMEADVQAAPAASTQGKRSIKEKKARAYEIKMDSANF